MYNYIIEKYDMFNIAINIMNTIFVNRRLWKVSKSNSPIVWDANIVNIHYNGNIGNIAKMIVHKFVRKEYSHY